MANDDLSLTTSSTTKCPITRKYQIFTDGRMSEKNLINDLYMNVVPIIGNSSTSKLPSLLSKSSVFSSTSETMHFKKYRPKQKGTLTKSSSFKIERQTSTIISPTRLPALNEDDQRRRNEFQRRQIYALNHFMRDLEQEKFRQFCELNENAPAISEELLPDTDHSNQQ